MVKEFGCFTSKGSDGFRRDNGCHVVCWGSIEILRAGYRLFSASAPYAIFQRIPLAWLCGESRCQKELHNPSSGYLVEMLQCFAAYMPITCPVFAINYRRLEFH